MFCPMICEHVTSMVIGAHEDRKRIIRRYIIEPFVRLGFTMFEAKIKILDYLMWSCIRRMMILDTDRILPQPPGSTRRDPGDR